MNKECIRCGNGMDESKEDYCYTCHYYLQENDEDDDDFGLGQECSICGCTEREGHDLRCPNNGSSFSLLITQGFD